MNRLLVADPSAIICIDVLDLQATSLVNEIRNRPSAHPCRHRG